MTWDYSRGIPGYDAWKTACPPEDPETCAACDELPGYLCPYCDERYCENHIDDHGEDCDDMAALDADADAAIDDEKERP